MLQIYQDHIKIQWANGLSSEFHFLWLRDNSPQFRHAKGQKLINTLEAGLDVAAQKVVLEDEKLLIEWQDGLISHYLLDDLYQWAFPAPKPNIILWDRDLASEVPVFKFVDVCAQKNTRKAFLQTVAVYGFGLLKEVPTSRDMLKHVVKLFGYIRETNYGKIFDVKTSASPTNLADTHLALSPHTDNPYRDPVPTIQLLHCLQSDTQGGETILVDGFQVANRLQAFNPEFYQLLSQIPVRFRYTDAQTDLLHETTILSSNPKGETINVRFNNRSIQAFNLPLNLTKSFYEAYQAFERMLHDPENQFQFKLAPGDLYIVDNERVLHGRTAFRQSGERLLQGCYADRDGLLSTLRVSEQSK
ncbi:MAG: TauD/TfdA family dioxygenase [Microscillaceae bacterium]|nr:TauD/TfdA family dioxygenase [Microscillaceae bacterium]